MPRRVPTLIDSLKSAGEKISQVDCGFKHAIVKTSLGKVYTWGWGERGQLGHGEFGNELHPRIVRINVKTVQVAAAHRSSIILTETRKILICGSNATV